VRDRCKGSARPSNIEDNNSIFANTNNKKVD
jgi:hypothetical protein